MSFRCRQKFKLARSGSVYESEQVTLESGEIVEKVKDITKEVLPDAELFDLKNQLKAGIEPEEVNSKLFSVSKVDGDAIVRKYTKRSNTKRSNNDETSDN